LNQRVQVDNPDSTSFFHRLDPRTKIICALLIIIISVSTPSDRLYAFWGYFALIAAGIYFSRIQSVKFFKRLLHVAPFFALALISVPFMNHAPEAGSYNIGPIDTRMNASGVLIFQTVFLKATAAVLTLTLLSLTTPFGEILKGFQKLRVPGILVMLAGFMYRYAGTIADEIRRMKRASESRLHDGKWLWHVSTTGRIIGTGYMRSYERAERIYAAMLSRGYEGELIRHESVGLKPVDFIFIATIFAFSVALRFI